MYVDLQQFAAVLLPLESAIFYPNGNSPGNTMENSGKQNPKMGFKSPPEHIVLVNAISKWLKFSYLRHRLFYVNNVINIFILTFCDAPFSLSVVTTTKSHNQSEKLS